MWAIWLIGIFYLFTLVLGFGAAQLVGAQGDQRRHPARPTRRRRCWRTSSAARCCSASSRRSPSPRSSRSSPGSPSRRRPRSRTTSTPASSRSGRSPSRTRSGSHGSPRWSSARSRSSCGILAKDQNVAFLVALAFAIAASANLPTILYSLFWKRFNTRGALWSIYGGLISTIIADRLLAGRVGQAVDPVTGKSGLADHRPGRSTSTGSRSTTRASCRSRWRSSSAGWAR